MFQENPKENLQMLAAILQDLQRQGVEWYPSENGIMIDFMRLGKTVGYVYKDSYLNTQVAVNE